MIYFTHMCFSGALVSMQICSVREQQQGDFVICVCGLFFFIYFFYVVISPCHRIMLMHRAAPTCDPTNGKMQIAVANPECP